MFLMRVLYIKGYNEVKLIFNNSTVEHYRIGQRVTVISQIHLEANRLSGMEVMQQKGNFCILKVLTESSIKDFDPILRRIFLLLTDASNDFVDGVVKGDRYLIGTIEEKHNTVTRFIANALRLLNRVGHPDHNKTQIYHHIIESLDYINDVIKDAARDVVDSDIKISKTCEALLNAINSSLRDFYTLFYKFDFKTVEKISSNRYKIWRDINQLTKKLDKDEIKLVTNVNQIVGMIYTLKVARMSLEY